LRRNIIGYFYANNLKLLGGNMPCIYCGHNESDEIFLIAGTDEDYACDDCHRKYGLEFAGSEVHDDN